MKIKTIFWVIILSIFSVSAFSTALTWVGGVSSDMTDANNWSPTGTMAGNELTIGAGNPNDPIFNADLETDRPNSFNTTSAANLVMTGGALYPYGNNTFNGNVTIKNGDVNTRSYAYIGSGATGVLTVDGGTFTSKYTMYIGRNSGGNGTLKVLEGIVYFPSCPSISYNGGTGKIYIEEGGFCYISGNYVTWFQTQANNGLITTASDSAIVIDYQTLLSRTCITAEKIVGATLPVPWDGTEDTDIATLSWKAGTLATASQVYLGTDYDTVASATTSSSEYIGSTSSNTMTIPYTLTVGTTYYWRVDTTRSSGQIQGDVWSFTPVAELKPRLMEKLDRGVIALRSGTSNYIGWRFFGTDPDGIGFNVYRGTTKLNSTPITDSTNYLDSGGATTDTYTIRPVIDDVEQTATQPVSVWMNSFSTGAFYTVPLQRVSGDADWSYEANDAAVGDLDGDGAYEIVIKRFSSDSGEYPVIDACRLDGTLLWRINLGPNHLSMVEINPIVYDFDSDGFAEVALRTCEGMTDGTGVTTGDTNGDGVTNYRAYGFESDGYIDAGPEFLSIFDGRTGAELARTDYIPRVALSQWGDNYGHRANKFHMVVAYLDGHKPSLVICRGIYALTKLEGWNYRDGKLTKLWHFTSDDYSGYSAQGNHNLSVGDVDSDGKDEIVYGSMCVDHDGSGLYTTGLGHGDAMHLSDMLPDRDGLEVWACHESSPYGTSLRDAGTGEIILRQTGSGDTGRATAAHVDGNYKGYQYWSSLGGLYDENGTEISTSTPAYNFLLWWDADLQRELLDAIGSEGKNPILNKWNGSGSDRLLSLYNIPTSYSTASNNYTKGNPCLSGDILGDWREEIILRSSDNTRLRIFSAASVTSYRFYTLLQDPQYRLAIAWQCCGYNQPPHPSFYIGAEMSTPPTPNIEIIEADADETDAPTPNPMNWAVKPYKTDSDSIAMRATTATDLSGVEYYFACTYGDGHDSGWQSSPFYEDTGLTAGVTYSYTVTARDKSDNQNTTVTSIPASCLLTNMTGLACWNFEDGTSGAAFSSLSKGGSVDIVHSNVLYGPSTTYGPSFSLDTISGNGLSAYFSGSQYGYTTASSLNTWSPVTWTIEVSVKLGDISGWETFIGRGGASGGAAEADFYLQRNGTSGTFRINILTVGGTRYTLDSDFFVEAYQWYRLAITSDGKVLTMYCDKLDGNGYVVVGTLDISSQTPAQNALAQGGYYWTFGRGWYNSSYTDYIIGYLDNIRFSNGVLTPEQFLGATPASMTWLYGDFTGDHIVDYGDFAVLSQLWLWGNCDWLGNFDLDSDCVIGFSELTGIADNWLTEQSWSVSTPLAWWPMNETSGTTVSESISGYNGTLYNSTGSWTSGKTGNALTFDGTDDYVEVSGYYGIGGTSARTVCAWIKTTSTGACTLVQWGDNAAGSLWKMYISSGLVYTITYGGGVYSTGTINDGSWHHVAAVLDEGESDPANIRLYIDGVEDTASYTTSTAINTTQNLPVHLGAWYRSGTRIHYLNGQLDDVRVYDQALTATEIVILAQ